MRPRRAAAWAITFFVVTSNGCVRTQTPGGFPGLAIEAHCRRGSIDARFVEADSLNPGEHATADPHFLSTMGELPLPCVDRDAESYRFVNWGGAFGTTRVIGVKRSRQSPGAWFVTQSVVPGSRARRQERQLTDAEWDALGVRLSSVRFWTLPARILLPEPPLYLDGCGCWTLEGYKDGRYHRIERYWDDPNLKALAEAFSDLPRRQRSSLDMINR